MPSPRGCRTATLGDLVSGPRQPSEACVSEASRRARKEGQEDGTPGKTPTPWWTPPQRDLAPHPAPDQGSLSAPFLSPQGFHWGFWPWCDPTTTRGLFSHVFPMFYWMEDERQRRRETGRQESARPCSTTLAKPVAWGSNPGPQALQSMSCLPGPGLRTDPSAPSPWSVSPRG